jgi:TrmH family RNA methyltransferase
VNTLYLKSNNLFEGADWENFFCAHGRPVVVGDGLRNPENIGALIRLADNVGAREVILLGSSETINLSRVRRVAASSNRNLRWQFMAHEEWLNQLPPEAVLVAIETTKNSNSVFDTDLPDHPVFVVGNEVHGISSPILERANVCVHIPVPGLTRSLNVSHAASVVLFEWLRQRISK